MEGSEASQFLLNREFAGGANDPCSQHVSPRRERFTMRTDVLTGFLQRESATGKKALTLSVGGWQGQTRGKSVGASPRELHLSIPQFGLVAEEVEKVNPDLVARDEQGKPYSVRYEAVNTMLLNEFLKEHQKVQRLEAAHAAVNERLKAQDAKIDKVNAQLELSRLGSRAVVTSQ
jgi:hypothetical protein